MDNFYFRFRIEMLKTIDLSPPSKKIKKFLMSNKITFLSVNRVGRGNKKYLLLIWKTVRLVSQISDALAALSGKIKKR